MNQTFFSSNNHNLFAVNNIEFEILPFIFFFLLRKDLKTIFMLAFCTLYSVQSTSMIYECTIPNQKFYANINFK